MNNASPTTMPPATEATPIEAICDNVSAIAHVIYVIHTTSGIAMRSLSYIVTENENITDPN
jgi:hypothetical protein